MNKKIALSNFLMIHSLQSNLILIFLYRINRQLHCCVKTRRIGTKGKKRRTTGKEEKKGKEGERDKGKVKRERSGRKRAIRKEGKSMGEKW